MAENQKQRHSLGRIGEAIIAKLTGGNTTNHKAPFDVVDFNSGVAYEVKAMSGLSKDLKIHISDSSMKRKKAFAREYHLKPILLAVIIYDEDNVQVYKGSLKSSVRINQMRRLQ
jgi:hypothetical protein